MNWEAIGAVGEVVGAVGVIITLLYLATQIRQNTMSNKIVALQTVSSQNADWLSLISQSDDVARIFGLGQSDLEALDDADLVRYSMLMTQFCRVFDAQYHQFQNKALPGELWESSVRSMRSVLQRDGARAWWARFAYQYSTSFQELVNRTLEQAARERTRQERRDT